MALGLQLKGADELIVKLNGMPQAVHDKLVSTVYRLAIQLETLVKRKLSGEVLNVQTGALRSGIFNTVTDSGTKVTGKVAAPKNVPYAAIHEFGGVIHHPGGTAYFIDSKSQLAVFVKNSDVRAALLPRTKPHDIVMPERSYLRSSLSDMREQIVADIKQSVMQSIRE